MKALNRGTVVTIRGLIMKAAHVQAKAWMGLDCICFDSYNQALSYALKKAWAAVRGEDLVFSWEPAGVVAVAAIAELLTPAVIEASVAASPVFKVAETVVGVEGEHESLVFIRMLKAKGLFNTRVDIRSVFDYCLGVEGILPRLVSSPYIVEFRVACLFGGEPSSVYYYVNTL